MWEGANPASETGKTLSAFNAAVADTDRLNVDREPEEPVRQQTLSKAIDDLKHKEHVNNLNDADKKALLSEMFPGASGFLEAIPSKELGLAWGPTEFVTEIRTRL